MEQTEMTRNIVELREFEAGTREHIDTIFNRLDKQDALIESMRELTANWDAGRGTGTHREKRARRAAGRR